MAASKNNEGDGNAADPQGDEPIPIMQQLLDNPFLLLALGIAVPTIFYIVWGIIEITQIPIAE